MLHQCEEQLSRRFRGIKSIGDEYLMAGSITAVCQQVDDDFMRQIGVGNKGYRDIAALELLIDRNNFGVCMADVLFGRDLFCAESFCQIRAKLRDKEGIDIVESYFADSCLRAGAGLCGFPGVCNLPGIYCSPASLLNPMRGEEKDVLRTRDGSAQRCVEDIQRDQRCFFERRKANQVVEVSDAPARSVSDLRP